MEITRKNWMQYIRNLAKADDKAADLITDYLSEHEILSDEGFNAFADYFYAVVTKYAEGASEMAAEAYEALADVQGAVIKSAMPAETPSYGECMKTIRGTMLDSDQAKSLGQAAGRLVRRTGVDTTINNALRDGAEWAWVPSGDTCAFCIMLASNGWQRASKKALKNGHAQHIHANCDCTYAVRFDGKSSVEGYDPDYYKKIYDNAEGNTYKEKLNSITRAQYANEPEKYRRQDRISYVRRKRNFKEKENYKDVHAEYLETAKPGEGKITIDDGREFKNREKNNMELIYKKLGGDIVALSEGSEAGTSYPDYLWRGHYWEEQEPQRETRNSIDANTREGIRQIRSNPGGIVMDIGNSNMPISDVHEYMYRRLERSADFDCDVILIKKGKIIDIVRYTNKK